MHVSFTNDTGMPVRVVEATSLKHDGPIGKELEVPRLFLWATGLISQLTRTMTIWKMPWTSYFA
ncbi:hypothetical protein NCCP2331_13970 [Sporosarcina sp. NCCP-2331]|nr:hypothetical protein NCCP2331_13970 [Sporosarcina sp. NCCP-2331]GLB55368.1 hypothetical protein NCCP2378_11550 [Sporosarcina sp. NCCP-2378]